MKESKMRKHIAEKLGAAIVTSCDLGGHRRFRSSTTGKWGYCTGLGEVVITPRFDAAEHFSAASKVYPVIENGKHHYYEQDFSNSWPEEQFASFRTH